MRIAFVKRKYVSCGGGELYLQRLMSACCRLGHDVHLVCSRWTDKPPQAINVHHVGARLKRSGRHLRLFSDAVARVVDREKFDITMSLERIEAQDMYRAGEGVHRVWLERRLRFEPRFSARMSLMMPRHRALLELEAKVLCDTPVVIANSCMVKSDIETCYPSRKGRIEVIYNGIDPAAFSLQNRQANREHIRREIGLDAGQRLILFVGSGFQRKGLEETLYALQRLEKCRLVVFGRDRVHPWWRAAQRLGVSRRVDFRQTLDELRPWYHAADVTVLPSWFDPFPNAGIEALSCGSPLVTSRYAGVHELIRPGINGEVIDDPSLTDDLCTALEKATAPGAGDERAAMIAATVAEHTIEENARKTVSLMEELAANGIRGVV